MAASRTKSFFSRLDQTLARDTVPSKQAAKEESVMPLGKDGSCRAQLGRLCPHLKSINSPLRCPTLCGHRSPHTRAQCH